MKKAIRPRAVGMSRSTLIAVALVCIISIVGFSSLAAGTGPEIQRQPGRSVVLARPGVELQARTGQNLAAVADSDSDVPAIAEGLIDHDQYLRLREQHIGRLRGLPYNLPYNARALAIQEMDRQEASSPTISTSTWSSIGPNPLPAFGSTVSGRVTAIAIHPTNPNIVYVGAAQGGVYRTTDGGANWTA